MIVATSASLLLDRAVRRGLLTEAQADECRGPISGAADPIAWLVDRRFLAADEARLLALDFDDPSRAPTVPAIAKAEEPEAPVGPQRIGPYEILRELGRGGMGVVYAARDPRLGREVAIKVLAGSVGKPERERFRREAQLAATLNHPHIVGVLDVGEEAGAPYLVMSLVAGETLEAKSIGRRDGARILRSVADAVHYAHERGVLHRDIKPQNILVDAQGDGFITDFGLARPVTTDSSLTVSGQILGTPAFMSPEQARGDVRRVDRRSDVWSLGATLYFLLTRRPPFEGSTLLDVVNAVLNREPAWPRKIDPTIHADLQAICLKALEKNPNRRYATAGEMAEDLRRFLDGEPVAARPPSRIYRLRRWTARRRVALSAGAIVLLVVAGILWARSWQARTRDFRAARDSAEAAVLEGDWKKALLESDRGLKFQVDGRLAAIAAESRARIAAEEADRRRFRWLQERLKPIEERIKEVRPFFYIQGDDLPMRLKEIEVSLADLESLAADPENAGYPEVWATLGIGWYHVGDEIKAERTLLRAERLNSRDRSVHWYLGKIYLARALEALLTPERATQEPLAKALQHFHRMSTGASEGSDMEEDLADLYRLVAEGKTGEVSERCRQGIRKYGSKIGSEEYWMLFPFILTQEDSELIGQALDEALRRRPHFAEAYFVRGMLRKGQEDLAGALRDFSAAIGVNARHLRAYEWSSQVRKESGDLDGAIKDVDRLIAVDPTRSSSYKLRGTLKSAKGDFAGAIADCTRAIELDPKDGEALCDRALARIRSGDSVGALADLDQAIASNPKSALAFYGRGVARVMRGDRAGAIADYSKAIELKFQDGPVYYQRAVLLDQDGKTDAALADYTEALQRDPKDTKARYGRGRLLAAKGEHLDAIWELSLAVQSDPKFARAWYLRGWTKLKMGDARGAVEDLTQSIDLQGDYPDAHLDRGLSFMKLKDWDAASRDLEKAMNLGTADWPRMKEVFEAMSQLADKR